MCHLPRPEPGDPSSNPSVIMSCHCRHYVLRHQHPCLLLVGSDGSPVPSTVSSVVNSASILWFSMQQFTCLTPSPVTPYPLPRLITRPVWVFPGLYSSTATGKFSPCWESLHINPTI